jgi:OPA family glycerol-3-phosphate transporter-like MFS transporter
MKPNKFRKEQWKMLLAVMFCYMFFYTGRHNFGWAAQALGQELDVSYSMIGWISFAMLIGYATGQLVNGNLADHFSPRIMVPVGGLLSVLCNILISFSGNYYVILGLWALNGFCQSMAWAPGSRLISNWWGKEEKGKAYGFYTMAAGSSSVITFLLSIVLLQQGLEWRWLFRLPVLLLLAGVVVFYVVARSKPSDKGYPNLSEDTSHLEETNWRERYRTVFRNRTFMIACLAMGFESMARYGFIFWVPIHYLGKDWKSNPHFLWMTVLMPVGMAIGGLVFGQISDTLFKGNRIAPIRIGMLACAVISIGIYVLPITNVWGGAVLMLLAGFFVYGPQANFWALSPDLLGETYVGTGTGIMNMSAYLFAALGEPLLGKVIDVTGNTGVVFIVISGLCLLCGITVSCVNTRPKSKMQMVV